MVYAASFNTDGIFLFGGVGIILIFIGTYVYLTKAR